MEFRQSAAPPGSELEGVNMSFGKMRTPVTLIEKRIIQDAEGFSWQEDVTVAKLRAYREGRHGTELWANRASFSEATDLFRFRCIPGVTVTTAMQILCAGRRFEITSVEDVRSRGMYTEVLAKAVEPGG